MDLLLVFSYKLSTVVLPVYIILEMKINDGTIAGDYQLRICLQYIATVLSGVQGDEISTFSYWIKSHA